MALVNKRITELPERLSLQSGDYVAVDGTGGTAKYQLEKVKTTLDATLTQEGQAAEASAVGAALEGKVDVETGKSLTSNDFTNADKSKLDGIEAQANKTVIDSTLTVTGQAADAKKVGDELTALKSDLSEWYGTETRTPIQFTNGYYIWTSGETIDVFNPTPNEWGVRYAVIPCSEGDKFEVSVSSGANTRGWAFVNSQGQAVSMADATGPIENQRITAPANTAYLVLNDWYSNWSGEIPSSYSINVSGSMPERVTALEGGKVDKQQGTANAGKVMLVGNDGILTPADIEVSELSNEAKIALLACFAHVAWIDDNGQNYYDALEDALYNSPAPTMNELYRLPTTAIFNGNNAVDTGVSLLSTDHDYTIVTDYTNGSVASNAYFIHCMHEDSPWYGLNIQNKSNNKYSVVGTITGGVELSNYSITAQSNQRLVIRHVGGSDTWKIDGVVDGVRQTQVTFGVDRQIIATSEHLIIGAQKINGAYQNYWDGTIRDFVIYDESASDSFVESYLTQGAIPEWGKGYTWLYNPANNILLSEYTHVSSVSFGVGCTEEISNNVLHVTAAGNTSDGSQLTYVFDSQTNVQGKITLKIKFNANLPIAATGSGVIVQTSNGTAGAKLLEKYQSSDSKNYFTSAQGASSVVGQQLQLNKWYIICVEIKNGQQVITINGAEEFNQSLATEYITRNAIIVQSSALQPNATDASIAWITYKKVS